MVKKIVRTLYVEGAAQHSQASRSECRAAFSKLFKRAGIHTKPRIVACGSRQFAFEKFCEALAEAGPDDEIWLLVDSEAPVRADDPWKHVKQRKGDGWQKPPRATTNHLHLMVQIMETWFLADVNALAAYFGKGFRREALPTRPDVESIAKREVYRALEAATKDTKSGPYGKGKHSFSLLAQLDPKKLERASPWALRLFQALAAS